MQQTKSYPTITLKHIARYTHYLWEQERAKATVQKYAHDVMSLYSWLDGKPLSKAELLRWKEHLIKSYAPASVNSMLAALNSFLRYMEWQELTVKPLKIQRSLFIDESKELTREEYVRLVDAAQRKNQEQLALIIQTICATGIRVSELRFITVKSVHTGRFEVSNKGKWRTVFLPGKLCRLLKNYLKKQKHTAGAVFVTRTGRPLDRSNIWREMKALCLSANVEPEKVFPHNLRHLFARTYYGVEKDLSRLADILGHTSVNTTRIYTAESGQIHARQLDRMGLVITYTT